MREFPFNIVDTFKIGLRKESSYREEDTGLELCFKMQPGEQGLTSVSSVSDPFAGGLSARIDFPFPQMFRTPNQTLLLSAASVHTINTGVTPWTLTDEDLYLHSDNSTSSTIDSDGIWHFVDLLDSWYAFNGSSAVFQTGLDYLTENTTPKIWLSKDVTIKTACTHKGRVWFGGFSQTDSNWLFTDPVWDDILTELKSEMGVTDQTLPFSTNRPKGNFVFWSSIGGGDFPLWFFYPITYAELGLGPSKEKFISLLKRNEFGWMPMPFNGNIEVMKPLGDRVIVYGSEGIAALDPKGAVVGSIPISQFGVAGRGSVGGDKDNHIFLDKRGYLWSLDPSLNPTRLGYKEFFSTFPATSTVISMKESPKELVISEPTESYIFSDGGLGKISESITSQFYLDGEQLAISTTASTSPLLSVQTGSFRNRRQAIKMIHDVQIDYVDIADLTVTVLTKFTSTGSFISIGSFRINNEGVATVSVSGLEFKLLLSGTPGANAQIDAIEVRWNLVDYRAIRGLFTPEGAG